MSTVAFKGGRPQDTLRDVGVARLASLSAALGYSEERVRHAVQVFESLTPQWHLRKVGRSPAWPTDITDDGTPFEFSVAFHSGQADLRMLIEPQAAPNTISSNWRAGLELAESLKRAHGIGVRAFEAVRDLFAPHPGSRAQSSIWNAVVVERKGGTLFKVYLNPRVHGDDQAPELVRQAVLRLGRPDIWQFLEPRVLEPGADVRYFSLDMDDASAARIKVYVGRRDSVAAISSLVDGTSNLHPGDAGAWIPSLTDRDACFDERPILTCFAFEGKGRPPAATLHVPVRCYLPDDATSAARVRRFLSDRDKHTLDKALAALSESALEESQGIITYASLRREPGGDVRATVYLSPQLYTVGTYQSTVTRRLR